MSSDLMPSSKRSRKKLISTSEKVRRRQVAKCIIGGADNLSNEPVLPAEGWVDESPATDQTTRHGKLQGIALGEERDDAREDRLAGDFAGGVENLDLS